MGIFNGSPFRQCWICVYPFLACVGRLWILCWQLQIMIGAVWVGNAGLCFGPLRIICWATPCISLGLVQNNVRRCFYPVRCAHNPPPCHFVKSITKCSLEGACGGIYVSMLAQATIFYKKGSRCQPKGCRCRLKAPFEPKASFFCDFGAVSPRKQ